MSCIPRALQHYVVKIQTRQTDIERFYDHCVQRIDQRLKEFVRQAPYDLRQYIIPQETLHQLLNVDYVFQLNIQLQRFPGRVFLKIAQGEVQQFIRSAILQIGLLLIA